MNLHLLQLDVHNDFLHGDLDKDVYMNLTKGLNTTHLNQVCKLLQ